MGAFGWSLPPGCGSLPGEDEYPCAICGNDVDHCICPECPECGAQGDPRCYELAPGGCGLTLTVEQQESHRRAEEFWRRQNEIDASYFTDVERPEDHP